MQKCLVTALAAVTLTLALPVTIAAQPSGGLLSGTYYMLPHDHPDVSKGIDFKIVSGLVASQLGPHGFPVATALAHQGTSITSGPISDLNSSDEIMWWSTGSTHGVKLDKTVTEKLPLNYPKMFPTGQLNDNTSFRTAHWRGTFKLAKSGTISLRLGSDDDSWVFVDGRLAVDNGGVKPLAQAPYTVENLSAGTHRMDIFYADRHTADASIYFNTAVRLVPAQIQH